MFAAMNLKKRVILIYSLLSLIFVSCSKEDATRSGEMGTFTMSLNATSEVIGLNEKSRAEEAGEGETLILPDVNDFSVSISSLGEQVCGWSSYKDMCEEEMPELRVGTYQVKAWYGDVSKEGFELPYFEGNQEFSIKKNETTPVEVTCYLGNAQVKVNYTDEFKSYFSDYSAVIATSLGNEVEYVKDETRAAYFSPGELIAKVKVKKSGQSTEAVYQAKVFTAESRHIYTLTLDVDAGSATMTVSFSEDVAGEEVRFDVSDAALNAPAPYFKANGFTDNVPLEPIEGAEQKEQVTAYVNAVAGIQSCRLTTTSDFLSEKGWPAVVDLAASGEYASILTEMGLKTKGLEGSRAQMAQVDFTTLIANLPTGGTHEFKLEATDIYGKVSETQLVLTVTPQGCEFSVAASTVEAPFYGNTCQVNVSFKDGNPANVHFQLMEGNKEALEFIRAEELSSEGGLKIYTVYLKAPETVKFINPFKVSASYLSYIKETGELPVSMGILVDNPGDVWAKKAVFHVYNETALADIKLQRQQGDVWTDVTTESSGSYSLVAKGLDSGMSLKLRAVKGEEYSNSVDITTEEELQVPNADMEAWSYEQPESNWKRWFPWNDDESTKGWNTLNPKTTSDEDILTSNYAYVNNSGTIETTDKNSGDKAALIRTVGWGEGTTAPGPFWDGSIKKVDSGYLYLGEYSETPETNYIPYGFTSRPIALSFYRKYTPSSGRKTSEDNYEVWVKVEYRNNEQVVLLGEGYLKEGGKISSYSEQRIPINYVNVQYQATHLYIIFKSGTEYRYDYMSVPPRMNLSTGEYVGSQLYVDDVKLIYE